MNTKDFLRLGVPLGEATRRPPSFHYGATSATDFISKFILGGGVNNPVDRGVKHVTLYP
jgi:hypothetical protein